MQFHAKYSPNQPPNFGGKCIVQNSENERGASVTEVLFLAKLHFWRFVMFVCQTDSSCCGKCVSPGWDQVGWWPVLGDAELWRWIDDLQGGVCCSCWIVWQGYYWIYYWICYWIMRGRGARETVIAEGGGNFIGNHTLFFFLAIRYAEKIFLCKTTNKTLLGQNKGQSTSRTT